MKFVFTLLSVAVLIGCAAPLAPVTLYMENGEVAKGFATQNPYKKVKFKTERQGKGVTYTFDEIAQAEYNTNEGIKRYIKLPLADKEDELVVQEIVTGRVSLYTTNRQGYNPGAPMGFGAAGGMGMGFGGYAYNIDNFYLKRETETGMTHLGSNQLFTKNFIKAASDYFKDCPQLVEKIEAKDYRKQDLRAIVTYYNENCD
ncbi:hypothetical protein [Leeuwenhoekiella sp. H156]|uniref:hypothetical protein n=1 Tax=Leeuwenhoekiella sp. H156 TaxID=3450128 RepID=UPI003FA46391